MKTRKADFCSFVLMLFALSVFTPLCHAETAGDKTTINEVKKETRDFIQALKAYTADQRDEAARKTRESLDSIDKKIDVLETKIDNDWDKMDQAAREKARASLKELHKQRNQVAEWHGSLKSSSVEAWENIKKGFSDAYSELQAVWEKSDKEFGYNKQE